MKYLLIINLIRRRADTRLSRSSQPIADNFTPNSHNWNIHVITFYYLFINSNYYKFIYFCRKILQPPTIIKKYWYAEVSALFLRIRFVNKQILFDLIKRISPSVRRNDSIVIEWIEKAFKQFTRWRHELVKSIKKDLEKYMSRRRGPRPR